MISIFQSLLNHGNGEAPLYRTARSYVTPLILALLFFSSLPQLQAAPKIRKGPRAIAVVQWEGDPNKPNARTSILVPIAILDQGRYYDAGIYRATPVPMAIDSGVEYEVLKSGNLVGEFVTSESSRQQDRWYGLGTFKPYPESARTKVARQTKIEPEVGHPTVYVPDEGRHKKDKDTDQTPNAPPHSKPDKSQPDTSASDADPDRPHLKRGGIPTVFKDSNAEEDVRNDSDPNRPKLRRTTKEEQEEAAGKRDPMKIFQSTALRTMVAVSDEYGQEPRPFTLQLKPEEENNYRAAALKLATQEIAKRAKRLVGPLQDVKFNYFDLYLNNTPVLVLSGWSAKGKQKIFATVVARVEVDLSVRKIFSSVTDSDHLDVYPRLELVDAVDADGDGRGDLLFRAYGDTGSRYVIYHAGPDSLELLFDSARAESGG